MILHGDCLEEMRKMQDNSISGIVTDPPYMIGFMGKEFDKFKDNPAANVNVWSEALRITKPGGFLLAFGADRTHHHLMIALENAGWELRTCIYWCFGQGFPKSHNHFGIEGYGTALKPAAEIIIMAMKPLEGTFQQNAEKWGQAGINIDGCRIAGESWGSRPAIKLTSKGKVGGGFGQTQWESKPGVNEDKGKGRWPANLLLDEEAAAQLDQMSGESKSPPIGSMGGGSNSQAIFGEYAGKKHENGYGDRGGASRFFFNTGNVLESQCSLCYNPCSKAEGKECKKLSVPFVIQNSKIIPETNENIVQKNAQLMEREHFAQNVKSAGSLCDRCAINIAHVLVEIKNSDSNKATLLAILDYMPDYKSYILFQSLVSFADLWGNIAITPTIRSLSLLFGSVLHAIENYTNQENPNLNGKKEQNRFLYCAKTSSRERNEGLELPDKNSHPTIKPLRLMRYLITLIMPPKDGILLDPFAGSGSTIIAAHQLGVKAIGIEKEAEYVEIARKRLEYWKNVKDEKEPDLFDTVVNQ